MGKKHLAGGIQNVEDDRNGRFHSICNRILKVGRRTSRWYEVDCKECMETPVYIEILTKATVDRLEGKPYTPTQAESDEYRDKLKSFYFDGNFDLRGGS